MSKSAGASGIGYLWHPHARQVGKDPQSAKVTGALLLESCERGTASRSLKLGIWVRTPRALFFLPGVLLFMPRLSVVREIIATYSHPFPPHEP